ncbi:MAG: diguanylate cyclase [Myxococcota bacterium]
MTPSPLRWFTVRRKLFAIAVVAELVTVAVSVSAWIGYDRLTRAETSARSIHDARAVFLHADMMHDALRGDVYRAVLATREDADAASREAIAADTARDGSAFRADLVAIERLDLDPGTRARFDEVRPELERYIAHAERVADEAVRDPTVAAGSLAGFEAAFREAEAANDEVIAAVSARVDALGATAVASRDDALRRILFGGGVAFVALMALTHLLARSIVADLAELAAVARRVVAGDLGARVRISGTDEIASLAGAFDEMADSLTGFVRRLESEAHRDGFRGKLVEALEMADEEEQALDVVRRAMVDVAPIAPMELLLSDSSRAHLQRTAVSPAGGSAGCPVQSPFGCVAVRRGNPVVFSDSEALNACARLRGRASGPCSAVCVPVTFMGRALGVLHATGPVGQPLGAEQVAQLTTLATQAGARIGTVRAFQKTQLQATTDGLTGLINRRTLENEVRQLLSTRTPFAVAVADLDKFKQLNDTHGHEAGDRALRTFAQVVKQVIRADDIAARHGGEEFVLVFPRLTADGAVAVLERLRTALAEAHGGDHPRFTASFGVTDSTRAEALDAMLRLADAALYQAKAQGRDRVIVATGSAPAPAASGERYPLAITSTETSASGLLIHRRRPALHQQVDEEEPRATGVEIR